MFFFYNNFAFVYSVTLLYEMNSYNINDSIKSIKIYYIDKKYVSILNKNAYK